MKSEMKAAELRRRIETRPGGRRGGFRGSLREDVLAYVRARLAERSSQTMIASELGVTQTSVSRWSRAMRSSALVAVQIVDAPRAASTASSISIVSPRGLRVEGLDLDAVCALLTRFG